MIDTLRQQLETALKDMERSFHVSSIATFAKDLIFAPADVPAREWLSKKGQAFDQFPVKDGNETIGVLDRFVDHGDALIRDAMMPLREGLIVSSDMPLTDLIPQLQESPYRLVLYGQRLDGLVTQSDLLKLPVRLVTFALITHLEQVMATLISVRWPQESWLSEISDGRRDKIEKKRVELSERKLDPPLLELTDFADKRELCKRLIRSSKSRFEHELTGLRDLRDQLAHAAIFIDPSKGPSAIQEFASKFQNTQRWIDELTQLIAEIRTEP
jgi:hypothetical protein